MIKTRYTSVQPYHLALDLSQFDTAPLPRLRDHEVQGFLMEGCSHAGGGYWAVMDEDVSSRSWYNSLFSSSILSQFFDVFWTWFSPDFQVRFASISMSFKTPCIFQLVWQHLRSKWICNLPQTIATAFHTMGRHSLLCFYKLELKHVLYVFWLVIIATKFNSCSPSTDW